MVTASGAPKVLIIDDEEDMCWAVAKGMQQEGYQVAIATGGPRGLELFQREGASVVLLDLKMPGMDGLEVLRRVRETDEKVPVILITGHGDMDVAMEAISSGATGYIIKPFQMDDLRQAVQRVLSDCQP